MATSNQDDKDSERSKSQSGSAQRSGSSRDTEGGHSSSASRQQSHSGSDNKQSGRDDNTQGGGRGFASMDPERQREIAAEGGRAAHASGHAHEFTPEEAREAGSMSHKNDPNRQSGDEDSASRSKSGGQGSQGGHGGSQGGSQSGSRSK